MMIINRVGLRKFSQIKNVLMIIAIDFSKLETKKFYKVTNHSLISKNNSKSNKNVKLNSSKKDLLY